MRVSIIVAMGPNNEIGKDNQLLWHIPEDLKNFKKLTMNHYVLMGRKTFESIGRVLPGRTFIILTKNRDYKKVPGAYIVSSIDEGIALAQNANESELFIIGGGSIYNQAIDMADRLYLSQVKYYGDADIFFPSFDFKKFTIISEKQFEKFKFTVLDR